MSSTVHPPSSTITRQRVAIEVTWMPVAWTLFAAATVLITAVFAVLGTVGGSAWESAAQLPRWYIAAVGAYFTGVHLPLYIAHGFSRREFMGQIPVYLMIAVTALSVLMTLGYPLEGVVYGMLGWPQSLSHGHLFTSPTELHLVFAEFWLVHLVWYSAGALVGAAFYRSGWLGIFSLPVGFGLVGASEATMRADAVQPIPAALPWTEGLPLVHAASVSLALAFVPLALTWLLIRDMPLRNKKG